MASRAMVKCDEDLPVVDADRGKHARALRVQRSCARVRVACSGVRTTYVRVHLCWDLSCSRARAARRLGPSLRRRDAKHGNKPGEGKDR